MDLKERIKQNVEIEDYGRVDEKLREEIQKLVTQERADFLEKHPTPEKTEEYKDAFDRQLIFSQSKLIVDDAQRSSDSTALVAKVDGELAGFSIFTISEKAGKKDVHSSFIGVSSRFGKKGIAAELLRQHHEVLQEMGINNYEVSVWDKSEALYRKMEQNGELEITHVGPRKHDHIVRLNPRD